MSRRMFLGMGAGLAAAAVLRMNGKDDVCAAPLAVASAADTSIKHYMWVWRFDVDGKPDAVLENIRRSGLSVVLKTNDGPHWMSRYDDSPTAITGPQKVREMADYFESAGIPFHAWCVVHGLDPIGEARICSEVLDNGARSMIFDLEPSDGSNYWQADRNAALVLGEEMRRLQPNARLGVAPDARPWQIDGVPTAEFATFVDEIHPQSYWETFDGPTNLRKIREYGFSTPDGMTPELILDVTVAYLQQFGLPIYPLGQGAANGADWERFVRHAYSLQLGSVGVWRYGTTHHEVWPTLEMLPPAQQAEPEPVAAAPQTETEQTSQDEPQEQASQEVASAETQAAEPAQSYAAEEPAPPSTTDGELTAATDFSSQPQASLPEEAKLPAWAEPLITSCD